MVKDELNNERGNWEMRYSRATIILLCISLFFILGLSVQGNNQQDIDLLIETFQQSGAELSNYWLKVGVPYITITGEDELLAIGKSLSQSLNLPEAQKLVTLDEQKAYFTKGSWGNGTEVELQIKAQRPNSNDMYLIFQLQGNENLEALSGYYSTLKDILNKNQISPKINTCIQGNINDKLSSEGQFVLIEKLLHSIAAEEVEKLDTSLVKSVSAYSPKLENYIWTNNNKMNIQIASHVNNLQQETVVTIGTPIITVEY